MNERKIAANIIYEIERNGAYTNIAIAKAFESDASLSSEGKGLISEIVHGVIEKRITLDYIISLFSSVKVNKIAPRVLYALRLGIYQLKFMDRIPQSAAVNESVKLAKSAGGQRSGSFVNAILRNFIRNIDNIKYPDNKNKFLSVYYSYPQDLIEFFVNDFGFEFTHDMLDAFDKRRPLTLRCNLTKSSPEKLLNELAESGVIAEIYKNDNFPPLNYALSVERIRNIEKLPTYLDGKFYIQDIAAMLVTEVLSPKPGDVVIDMCAAPGGKTTHVAEKMNNSGTVYCFDIHEHKINLIRDNAERLGLGICKPYVMDASVFNEEYIECADCVLVDAPCSGFGIMGRKPDIKYNRSISDVAELSELSYKILCNAAEYVKPGGTLVFSTCTITRKENESTVKRFLNQFGEKFSLEIIDNISKPNEGYITFYPHVDDTDGFFICKLRKKPKQVSK